MIISSVDKQVDAKALRGYKFFRHPDTATLGVLRLDTEDEQHWFLVTRQTLQMLSEVTAKHAQELAEIQ